MRRIISSLIFGALLVLTPALIGSSSAQTPPAKKDGGQMMAPAAKKDAAPAAKKDAAPAAKVELIDINRASAKDLDALPGIGEGRSKAIIAGRPYKAKDELTKRKIIPQNVYDAIKDKIIAHQM
jgi:competence protein ComEA